MPARLSRRLHTLLLVLLCASLGACSSLLPGDPPQIQVAGLEPLPGEGLEARFALALRIQNPNSRTIDYQGIAVDLQVNGQPLATLELTAAPTVQQAAVPGALLAGGQATFEFRVDRPFSPASLGGEDHRRLGFALINVLFVQP